MKSLLKKIYENIIFLLLPYSEDVKKIEQMSTGEFRLQTKKNFRDLPANIHSFFDYKDKKVKTVIWEAKYRGNPRLIELMASLIYEELIFILGEEEIWSNFDKPILIPIPISKTRFRERGFNQCEEVAKKMKSIDEGRSFELELGNLIKVKDTVSQTKKNKLERQENLRNCFSIKNHKYLVGRNVILLDDVYTTGATIEEAKRTLKNAGVRKVIAITFAH